MPFLAKAYIYVSPVNEFDEIKIIDENDDVSFIHHIDLTKSGRAIPESVCFDKRDGLNFNNNDFWSVYIVSAFEGPTDQDIDPDKEDGVLGFTPFIDKSEDNCVLIFQEVIRDSIGDPLVLKTAENKETVERFTVLHEVGHALNLQHALQGTQYTCDKTIMDIDWPWDFVDKNSNGKWQPNEPTCPMPDFTAQDLANLRSIHRPGSLD